MVTFSFSLPEAQDLVGLLSANHVKDGGTISVGPSGVFNSQPSPHRVAAFRHLQFKFFNPVTGSSDFCSWVLLWSAGILCIYLSVSTILGTVVCPLTSVL